MATRHVEVQRRRIDYAVVRRNLRQRVVDPLSGPRGLAIGLAMALMLWLVIAVLLDIV